MNLLKSLLDIAKDLETDKVVMLAVAIVGITILLKDGPVNPMGD